MKNQGTNFLERGVHSYLTTKSKLVDYCHQVAAQHGRQVEQEERMLQIVGLLHVQCETRNNDITEYLYFDTVLQIRMFSE